MNLDCFFFWGDQLGGLCESIPDADLVDGPTTGSCCWLRQNIFNPGSTCPSMFRNLVTVGNPGPNVWSFYHFRGAQAARASHFGAPSPQSVGKAGAPTHAGLCGLRLAPWRIRPDPPWESRCVC